MRGPRETSEADIAAVDRGVGRVIPCAFRGLYGPYPRKFKHKMLHLTPAGLVLRPIWFSLDRRPLPIGEQIISGQARSRDRKTDWRVKGAGAVCGREEMGIGRVYNYLLRDLERHT